MSHYQNHATQTNARAHPASSEGQGSHHGPGGHQDREREDLNLSEDDEGSDYNLFDNSEYDEEEAEDDTREVENPRRDPKEQFMDLLRQNLDRPPVQQPPNNANANAFRNFKS